MSTEPSASLVICGQCGDVVGPEEVSSGAEALRVQAGRCPDHRIPEQPKWAGHDFNRFLDLCHCCGTVPMMSGSRWCTWFCPPCREQVDLLNQRLGRYAIPIGRHSVHGARLFRSSDFDDPMAIHSFTEFNVSVREAILVLHVWSQHVVRLNLRTIGEGEAAVVPIQEYCVLTQASVDPTDRFREMCDWLTRAVSAHTEGRDAPKRVDSDSKNVED